MQGEIYHTIKASQMYAPFQRRQEEDKGGVKWGGVKQQRHEGRGWHEKA